MSTYKQIFGKDIQTVSADPTTAVAEGQIWYNSTTGTYRTILRAGAWSAGGNLSSARTNGCAGGLQNSALYAGGGSPGAVTELYNGTAWSTSPATMNTARFGHRGAGTQTSYIMTGNDPSNVTESWNGSGWTTEAVYPSSVSNIGASGTDAAAVFFGGGPTTTATNYWTGSAWTAQTGVNQGGAANNGPMGASQSDALFLSGTELTGVLGRTQTWNGTSWTSQGTSNLSKDSRMNMSQSSTYAVSAGGRSPYKTETELFDGSAWTTTTSLTTAQAAGGGAGSASSGLTFGGNYPGSPDVYNGTQEWDVSTSVAVAASWSSAGNLVNTRDSLMTAAQATQPAAFVFGGHNNSGTLTFSEAYNGTAWTATNALPVSKQLGGGAGTQAAALCFGGESSPPSVTRDTTETWDGSNWTAVAAPGGTLGTGRFAAGSAGTQGAALMFGGNASGATANSEEWNGSSWTEGHNMTRGTTGSQDICGAGIQTSALAMGGTSPSFVYSTTEEYDGTSWSGGGGLNTARRRAAAAASTVDAGLCFGGLASPGSGQTAAAELYDGTSWTNTASMGTARYYLGGSGSTQGDGFAMGGLLTGAASSFTDKTEEFTAPGTVLNYKTLTTS